MDGIDISNLGSSLRRSSSLLWRSQGGDVFSTSSRRDENDEEALRWAALEKLPTYDRLRRGILTMSHGVANEMDVQNLGFHEKKNLLQRLVNDSEKDNEKFLLKLKDRIERVGIEIPTIEVRYETLDVKGEVYGGSGGLPTFLNFITNIVEGVLNLLHVLPNRKKQITILNDISGIIKPKRMTLLLGPPSSGKTTLLLALAGKLDKDLKVSGNVTYNGHKMNEFVPQRSAAYISQNDVHIGELTVRETLSFSARFQGVGYASEMLAELCRREKVANIKPDTDVDLFMKASALQGLKESVITDYILKILGLEICADTMVGDETIRGVSGGQRKRVTTGEMLVGPAKALFMDEISTGLDSSTTYQIVNSIRQSVHILNGTAVISLLQPTPETYNLFDDIILISDGQIVYQGPREHVLEFFESMGFVCPLRKGVADFLQEVTSKKDQEQYWGLRDVPYRFIGSKEFAEAFLSFHVGMKLTQELSTAFVRSKSHPAALTTEKYGVGTLNYLKACFDRELLLMKRNSFVYVFKLIQFTIVSILAMTVFFRTKMHKDTVTDGSIFCGALFFGVVMTLFNGKSELPMTIAKLPVFYKQRDLFFFPSWAYFLPIWILKIPITFVEIAVWVFLTYYVTGFDPNVGRLFKFYLILVLVNQTTSSLFRSLAALGRTMVVAYTFGLFAVTTFFVLSGFVLSKGNIKPWWIWGYWTSPMMYAQNAIVVNEFLGHSWRKIPAGKNETLGVEILKSRGFYTNAYWYWIGVGALLGFIFIFNIIFVAALAFLSPFKRAHAIIEDDDDKKINGIKLRQQKGLFQGDGGEIVESTLGVKEKGMVIPFEQHSITFDQVRYSVDMPKEMKSEGVIEDKLELLKGVSGAFRPGVLTALMGVSGAGKTTLMDVLAGRKTGGYVEGDIKISGYPKKQETFSRISGYCEQNDIHSPCVTVYESLLYSAWLRLSSDVNSLTREMFVEGVMELVELTPLRGALVGLPGVNGLSTEQRKRLTIAVELVANPSIIFMDEPTSGLDARAAAIVMRAVRNTVDTGRAVVCTIHQPSIAIFEAFDELFLMRRGGQEIYFGPLGHNSSELVHYFESIPGVQTIPNGYNPATWMLEVSTPSQEQALGVDFADLYKNSDIYKRNKAIIQELGMPRPGSKDLHFSTQYSQPFLVQTLACLWKQHWSYWHNPLYTAVRFLFTTITAIMFGTIFWQIGGRIEKTQDLLDTIGFMYAAVQFIGIQYASSVQPVVGVERIVFYREKAAGMYSALPYAFAQALIEIPYIFFQSTIYCIIVYAMVGFEWSATKFFWHFFFMFFSLCYFTYYGMMTLAITPNNHVASMVASFFYGIWNLFTGFLIPRSKIPIWWRWYYYICPLAWSLYGLVASQYGDIQKELRDSPTNETIEDFIKTYFGYHYDFLGQVAAIVVSFSVFFTFIFAFAIKNFNFQKR